MESLFLLILLLVIVLLIFPLTFDIKLSFDVLKNRGALSVRLWFIWIKVAKIKREGKMIILIEKYKENEKEFEISEEQFRFLNFFNDEVKDKIKVRKIVVNSKVGNSDPFRAGLLSGVFSSAVLAILASLKNIQPTATLRLKNETDFYNNSLAISIWGRLSLSIFDVLYSFTMSILRTRVDRKFGEKVEKI